MKQKKAQNHDIKTQEKHPKHHISVKMIYFFVLISFIVPIVFLIFRLIFMDEFPDVGRSSSDYVLMIVQCVLGAIAVNIPTVLSKHLNVRIPVLIYILFLIFLYCAIFLGEVGSFYYIVPHWDDILHLFSSMMTGFFGYMLVAILNGHKNAKVNLSPTFIAIFAFCFSVTIGAVWEIYEFSIDGLLGLNSQKFRLEDGVELIGRNALTDTMKDIIVDCLGALAATILGWTSMLKRKGFVYDYYSEAPLNKKPDETDTEEAK